MVLTGWVTTFPLKKSWARILEEGSYETVVGFGDAKMQERSATQSPGYKIILHFQAPSKQLYSGSPRLMGLTCFGKWPIMPCESPHRIIRITISVDCLEDHDISYTVICYCFQGVIRGKFAQLLTMVLTRWKFKVFQWVEACSDSF